MRIRSRLFARMSPLVALSVLAVLLGASFSAAAAGGQYPQGVPSQTYLDHGLSALAVGDRITLGTLERSSGGNLSVGSLENFVRQELLRFDVREVLLDIGWANYSVNNVPYEGWVNNWFSACDSLGVQNVLFVGQLTSLGVGSPWVTSLISADPAAQTYYQDGKPAPYISPDNPDVTIRLEQDLATLYSYYGAHPSWVGLGTGSTAQDPYYGSNSTMPALGYSNTTLASFAGSAYFGADVNGTGYDPGGTLDALWAEFRDVQPSTLMSSGNWQLSNPVSVYGTARNGSTLALRFYLDVNRSSVQIEWYGSKQGNTSGDMLAQVLPDAAGKPDTTRPLASQLEPPSTVTQSPGWQGPLVFPGNFTRGYYWFYLSAAVTGRNDSYQVYARNYPVDNLNAMTAGNATSGHWSNAGESLLWVKDSHGADLALYPYDQPLVVPNPQQSFVANSSSAFNTVYLFLSDRHYNPTNGTLTIVDTTTQTTIDTGVLSQALTSGLQNWIPIQLNHTAVLQKGDSYLMTISEPNGGYSWIVALRGLSVDPPAGGFQGQSQFWLFRLAQVDWGATHLDFTADTSNGLDAVSIGHPDAVRFTAPSSAGGATSLSGLSIFMKGANPGTFYPQGVNMTVSVYPNGKANGTIAGAPTGPPLASVTVPGGSIPRSGWLNVTGFNLALPAGGTFWVVFSTLSNHTSFPMARLVSPYDFQVLVSRDGGRTWANPSEGPTDFAFVARFSDGEQLGNFIQGMGSVPISRASYFAQPFLETRNTQATGVFIGPIAGTQHPNDFFTVSINPSDGAGEPSAKSLAEGRLYAGNITLNYGLQFVQFPSVARLQAGQAYWIVIKGGNGVFFMEPVVYSYLRGNATSPMVSSTGGYRWIQYSNFTSVLSYRVASPSPSLPTFNTGQLVNDLLAHHSLDSAYSPSAGWNSYVQSSEIQREATLNSWFRNSTGGASEFYGTGAPSVLTYLNPRGFVYLPAVSTPSTCQGLYVYMLSTLPSEARQYSSIGDLALLKSCSFPSSGSTLQQLSFMRYMGPWSGPNTGPGVLVIGDTPTDSLSSLLRPAYNVTYLDFLTNPDTVVNALQSVQVVVLDSSNLGSSLAGSIGGWVHDGGTLIVNGPVPTSLGPIFEGSPAAGPAPTGQNSSALKEVLDRWTENTIFFNGLSVATSDGSLTATGQGLTLMLNPYGFGTAESISRAAPARPQVSQIAVVLSNMVRGALSPGSVSPFWYGSGAGESSLLVYGIEGSGSGQMLLWVSNPGSGSEQFSVSLNGTFYGLPKAWKIVDLSTLGVSAGVGSTVSLVTQVPPLTWIPFYIVPNNSSVVGDYSSLQVASDLRYPNQLLVTSGGPTQSALLVLSTASTVANVSVSGGATLPRAGSASVLLSTHQGWYYDNSTNTLFIEWANNSTTSLRVSYVIQAPLPSKPFPMGTFLVLFFMLLIIEVVVLVYLRFSKRPVKPSRDRSGVTEKGGSGFRPPVPFQNLSEHGES